MGRALRASVTSTFDTRTHSRPSRNAGIERLATPSTRDLGRCQRSARHRLLCTETPEECQLVQPRRIACAGTYTPETQQDLLDHSAPGLPLHCSRSDAHTSVSSPSIFYSSSGSCAAVVMPS